MAKAMLAIREAVGDRVKIGMPPVAAGSPDDNKGNQAPQTYFPVMARAVAQLEKTSGKHIVDWIATHNYDYLDGQNFTTTVGGGGARGQLGFGPMANRWYEAEAAKALGRDLKSLSTEGGPGPDSFRKGDVDRVQREMRETMDQLNGDSGLTANLWLLYESSPGSDRWDKFALGNDGEGPWVKGLEDYRRAYREAQ